jgi:hypothetical protein
VAGDVPIAGAAAAAECSFRLTKLKRRTLGHVAALSADPVAQLCWIKQRDWASRIQLLGANPPSYIPAPD